MLWEFVAQAGIEWAKLDRLLPPLRLCSSPVADGVHSPDCRCNLVEPWAAGTCRQPHCSQGRRVCDCMCKLMSSVGSRLPRQGRGRGVTPLDGNIAGGCVWPACAQSCVCPAAAEMAFAAAPCCGRPWLPCRLLCRACISLAHGGLSLRPLSCCVLCKFRASSLVILPSLQDSNQTILTAVLTVFLLLAVQTLHLTCLRWPLTSSSR